MNNNVTKPQEISFFVPVGIGVLALMLCAGLLTAITAIGFTSPSERSTVAQASGPTEIANSNQSDALTDTSPISQNGRPFSASTALAATAEPNADAPLDSGSSDTAGKSADLPSSAPSESAAAPGDSPAEVQPVATGRPLDDVRNRSRKLPIAGEGVTNEIALCLIRVSDPAKVDLEILGGEFAEPQKLTVKVDRVSSDDKSCTWKVTQVVAAGFDRTQNIGEFLLKDQQFSFRWLKDADKGKLPFCRLKISADADTEVCDLWSSVHPPALRLSFNNSNQKLAPFVAPRVNLPPVELMQLELTFEGWPEHEQTSDTLVLNEELNLVFPDVDSGLDLLKIQLALKADGGHLAVHASYTTNVPESRERSGKDGIKHTYVEKDLSHANLEKLSAKIAKESEKYQRELAGLNTKLHDLEKRLTDLNRQVNAGFAQARPQLAATGAEIVRTEKQKTQAEELSDVFSAAVAAMEQLSQLIDDIERKGLIHFQLTRPLGGVESPVVISSSINAAAEAAGRVP